MHVPRQVYDSCSLFVWCVLAYNFAICLGTFCLEFSFEFGIFDILLFISLKSKITNFPISISYT